MTKISLMGKELVPPYALSLTHSCLQPFCNSVRVKMYGTWSTFTQESFLICFSHPLLLPQHHWDGAGSGLSGHHTSRGGRRWVTTLRRGTLDGHLRTCPQTALLHSPAQGNAGWRWEKEGHGALTGENESCYRLVEKSLTAACCTEAIIPNLTQVISKSKKKTSHLTAWTDREKGFSNLLEHTVKSSLNHNQLQIDLKHNVSLAYLWIIWISVSLWQCVYLTQKDRNISAPC